LASNWIGPAWQAAELDAGVPMAGNMPLAEAVAGVADRMRKFDPPHYYNYHIEDNELTCDIRDVPPLNPPSVPRLTDTA
jgi:hypothetical protein